jgi:YHS domain-containing protein
MARAQLGNSGEPAAGDVGPSASRRQRDRDPRDPGCSMAVAAQSPVHFVLEGTKYHFRSGGCREGSAAAPERFLDRAPALAGANAMDTPVIRKERSP